MFIIFTAQNNIYIYQLKYEVVIGLEVHIQLNLKSKIFAADNAAYGALPNAHVSPLTLGHPGTLPVLNEKAIAHAVRLGLACGCDITPVTYFARKHYFYADLPKGYQITQDKTPICRNGFIKIHAADGKDKRILLSHIHLEEDAGKSIHDSHDEHTLIDLNRAGVTLMEMVTQPVLSSPEEAHAFLSSIRRLVRYLHICDGNMEEGSLRCDANISLRLKGSDTLGTKVEIKNLNSMRFLQRALHFEIQRQEDLLTNGKPIQQETRSYDSHKDITFSMRDKESAHDYRYFPEPDIPPVVISKEYISDVRLHMPSLPDEVITKYTTKFGLSMPEAIALIDQPEMMGYFENLIQHTHHYRAAANWMLGNVQSFLHEEKITIADFILEAHTLAALINIVEKGLINHSAAAQRLLPALIKNPSEEPLLLAEQMNLLQNSNEEDLIALVNKAVSMFPEKVAEYKKGRKGLLGLFIGEAMKISGGKADPQLLQKLMKEALDQQS